MYRLWSKCVPMNLKRTPMTFKIKLIHNFGPLSITFSLRRPFSAKMARFCVFGRVENREPKQFQSKWPSWFFLVHLNTFLPQSKQNSNFSFFAFLRVPVGVCGIFRPPVQGGSSDLISKFLSSMILYNHSSYFKSREINSCWSPFRTLRLPTLSWQWSKDFPSNNKLSTLDYANWWREQCVRVAHSHQLRCTRMDIYAHQSCVKMHLILVCRATTFHDNQRRLAACHRYTQEIPEPAPSWFRQGAQIGGLRFFP